MFNASQISLRIAEMINHQLSVEDFERWFRAESKNFHYWASENLSNAIFEVEGVLSEYHLARLEDDIAVKELVNAIRPFDRIALPVSPRVPPTRAMLIPDSFEPVQRAGSPYVRIAEQEHAAA